MRLTIILEVDGLDPTLVDPHIVAEDLFDEIVGDTMSGIADARPYTATAVSVEWDA